MKIIIFIFLVVLYIGIKYYFYKLLVPKEIETNYEDKDRLKQIEDDYYHLESLLNKSKYTNWTLFVIMLVAFIFVCVILSSTKNGMLWDVENGEYYNAGLNAIIICNMAYYLLLHGDRMKQIENKMDLMRENYSLQKKVIELNKKIIDDKKQ